MDDQQTINIIKGLIIDGVDKAKSGHPGGAMSSIDFAYLLFKEYLRFDPADPNWLGRDRFVLSAGHESMLLYSLLHMNGWLELDELKNFRQLHSKTPGHPENHLTPGVECTTGPLGQGAAMSVGFAIGATHLRHQLDANLFGHRTYALLGDGCMQEDITLGAASYAGHLKLGNLVWYYDRNRIQISGGIARSTSDDEAKIFAGFGWNVVEIDGHDHGQIRATLDQITQSSQEKPTLVIGNTTIANGAATVAGSSGTHGAPLAKEERLATRKSLGLPEDQAFFAPEDALSSYRQYFPQKSSHAKEWRQQLDRKLSDATFKKLYDGHFTEPDLNKIPKISWNQDQSMATRNSFGAIIEAWADHLPALVGGSADLEPSNMTGAFAKKVGDFQSDNPGGKNFAFGVREFPMSAICNGLSLHGGFIPFDATFLTFSDYSRAALRLGALQKTRVIHEFTHDSFYLGEDGPTHQSIEHVMSLRLIPDFHVMRPADSQETEVLMRECLRMPETQVAICLSRQKLPHLQIPAAEIENARKGAYIVHDADNPDTIIFATGSEVSLALEVAELSPKNSVRVVSVPCWELFFKQDAAYQQKILAPGITRRVSIEAGVTLGWERFTGTSGLNIGIDHFGASAPAEDLAKEYGFTADQVLSKLQAASFGR